MKTRNLLLLSLGCGLAIMVAGLAFFVRLARQDDVVAPVPLGDEVVVGDMSVVVTGSDESGGVLDVEITIGGTVDDDPADEFRLIASARPVALTASTCGPSDAVPETCTITFDLGAELAAGGVSRVLFYERGDDQARWVLG